MFVKKEITAGNTGTDGDKKQNGRKKRENYYEDTEKLIVEKPAGVLRSRRAPLIQTLSVKC